MGIEDPGRVGQQDQLLCPQMFGNRSGNEIGVDVVGLAVRPHPDRGDDRDDSAADQGVQDAAVDVLDLPDMADVDDLGRVVVIAVALARVGEFARPDEVRILPRDPHGAAAGGVEQ